ncbi:MAG: hypothetical protein AB1632_14125 [Nitrospirota bacterium]
MAEKDKVISGMLQDELRRCEEMLDSLKKSASKLPKGVLSLRKKRYKKKLYSYYYLKYREGKDVVSKHISNKNVQDIAEKLEQRKKYIMEIKSYEKRIAYLEKMLKAGRKRVHANRG